LTSPTMSVVSTPRYTNPLLLKYLTQLSTHPLRTKALTTATLCFLQEVLGSKIAGAVPKVHRNASPLAHALASFCIDAKAAKMAVYGFLVSAPLSHYLFGVLQKAFEGKTSSQDKIRQILASNLLISPIQVAVFLASTAIINGATSLKDILKTVKVGFLPAMRISWIVSPVSMTVAQKLVPVELWVPFFSLIQFTLGTYMNVRVKSLRITKKKDRDEEERKDN